MEHKLTYWQRLSCRLIGWNPEILANCGESSFRSLRKYITAMIIPIIIWGVIGFCFAERYIGIETWWGKSFVATVFITVVICIERFIILNDGGKRIFCARIILAFLMAVLGSTILDQLIFNRDVNVMMKNIRTEQINIEVPKRMNIINSEIKKTSQQIDSLGSLIEKINIQISNTPAQIKTSDVTRNMQKDSLGNNVEVSRSVVSAQIINPRFNQLNEERKMIGDEANQLRLKQKELFEKKLNIENDVREEYQKIEPGFLEELKVLFDLIIGDLISIAFYLTLFSFLFSLELLVLLSKWGDYKCDYELTIESQKNIKIEKLKHNENAILKRRDTI